MSIEATETASFSVVETALPDEWQSVIFTGALSPCPESTAAYTAIADTAEFPAMYTFEDYYDMDTVEQSLYQLTVESRSARRAHHE